MKRCRGYGRTLGLGGGEREAPAGGRSRLDEGGGEALGGGELFGGGELLDGGGARGGDVEGPGTFLNGGGLRILLRNGISSITFAIISGEGFTHRTPFPQQGQPPSLSLLVTTEIFSPLFLISCLTCLSKSSP